MSGYRLTPRARRDLDDIWLYSYDRWSAQQADAYYLALIEALRALAENADRGSPVSVRPGYRKLLSGSHYIYFKVSRGGIQIVRILHQAMDVRRHL